MVLKECPYCGCKEVAGYHWLDGKFVAALDEISESYWDECEYIQCLCCKKYLKR